MPCFVCNCVDPAPFQRASKSIKSQPLIAVKMGNSTQQGPSLEYLFLPKEERGVKERGASNSRLLTSQLMVSGLAGERSRLLAHAIALRLLATMNRQGPSEKSQYQQTCSLN